MNGAPLPQGQGAVSPRGAGGGEAGSAWPATGLGNFDATLLDEAKTLSAALRDRPAVPLVLSDRARDALALRNKIISMLTARMAIVRGATRFVFRDDPSIARQVTSAYERRKRAAARREAAKKKAPGAPSV